MLGVVLDGDVVIDAWERPTPTGSIADDGRAVLEQLTALLGDVLASRPGAEAATIGVGLPGMLGADGVLLAAPNLLSAQGAAIAPRLEEAFGRRVVLANDADCAAIAEAAVGVARMHDDVLLVTLGTGIGGGIIAGGRLLRGGRGYAGEIGHVVIDPGGPQCPCGARGCWEQFASGTALGRLARDAARAGRLAAVLDEAGGDVDAVRGEQVTRAAAAGDAEALVLVEEVAWWLARGLANLVAVLDPTMIVLGGGLATHGELLVDPVRRLLPGMLEGGRSRPGIEVVLAELGPRAGAVGAALLGRGEQ
jgi:glucokinase